MEHWNPWGWLLLAGGFAAGVLVAMFQAGQLMWLAAYGAMLAGLTILVTNMLRAFWRYCRKPKDF
ncbi:MAG: hypothetical protein ACE5DS_10975 [Kiloniellaceae bacterium]